MGCCDKCKVPPERVGTIHIQRNHGEEPCRSDFLWLVDLFAGVECFVRESSGGLAAFLEMEMQPHGTVHSSPESEVASSEISTGPTVE